MKLRRLTTLAKAIRRRQIGRHCLKQTERLIGHALHVGLATIFVNPGWFSAPPGLTPPMGLCADYWRNEPFCRAGDIGETSWSKMHTSFTRSGRLDGRHTAYCCTSRGRGRFKVREILACHGDLWVRSITPRFPRHPMRRLVCAETVLDIMTATRCAVALFRGRVAGMLAKWFSLHERLIFPCVSNDMSLQLEEERPCSETNGSSVATRYEGNEFAFSEG